MPTAFDPGYGAEPFRTLVQDFPDSTDFPTNAFRVEWGPVFHRGRLDGTARVLAIGQDPAQHETIVRRVLVGMAGHRVQGFLEKLGITRSYVIINAFLYAAFNQPKAALHVNAPGVSAYRNQWFDALLGTGNIEAVVAFGNLADTAWNTWKATPAGAAVSVTYHKVTHPTAPRTNADLVAMLKNWNTGLAALRPAILHPDVAIPATPYGTDFLPTELVAIPDFDTPAGTPEWMRTAPGWAARVGATVREKRATIVVKVPDAELP